MKVVAFVPIKLNSERVPHKNLLLLGKSPLCYYVPNALLQVPKIDEIYVYCSDEAVIPFLPEGVEFLKRDSYLDGNLVKGKEIYDSFIELVDADIYLLAHTTSPFTKPETIEKALEKVMTKEYDSAFSAQKIQTFAWYQNKPINYDLNDIPRTQDLESIYVETSAFFIFHKKMWIEHGRRIGFSPYIQEVNDIEAIEIDTMNQYEFAKIVAEGMENNKL